MTGTGQPKGEDIANQLITAEKGLKAIDPVRYREVEQWYDKELYGALYGAGGVDLSPISHLPAIRDLLQARAAMRRAQARGTITAFRGESYDSEVGNERMAQAIDACMAHLGTGTTLPPFKSWEELFPTW